MYRAKIREKQLIERKPERIHIELATLTFKARRTQAGEVGRTLSIRLHATATRQTVGALIPFRIVTETFCSGVIVGANAQIG